jgi:hypothetical protein
MYNNQIVPATQNEILIKFEQAKLLATDGVKKADGEFQENFLGFLKFLVDNQVQQAQMITELNAKVIKLEGENVRLHKVIEQNNQALQSALKEQGNRISQTEQRMNSALSQGYALSQKINEVKQAQQLVTHQFKNHGHSYFAWNSVKCATVDFSYPPNLPPEPENKDKECIIS